jgi:hypothetical protein
MTTTTIGSERSQTTSRTTMGRSAAPRGGANVAGTVKDAHQPPLTRAYFSNIRRGAVVDAEEAINALVARSDSDGPWPPRGWRGSTG